MPVWPGLFSMAFATAAFTDVMVLYPKEDHVDLIKSTITTRQS